MTLPILGGAGGGVQVQREYLALSYSWFWSSGIELAGQVRTLYDRPAAAVPMDHWLDAGAAAAVAGNWGTLRVEYLRSVTAIDGTPTVSRRVFAATARVKLSDDWAVGIDARGEGADESEALNHLRLGVVISFADVPLLEKSVAAPGR